jgi:hypothetical protein
MMFKITNEFYFINSLESIRFMNIDKIIVENLLWIGFFDLCQIISKISQKIL